MQKELLNDVDDVLPLVEHRYCARHVLANWQKKWHSGEMRKRFWWCVWSFYEAEFNDNLKKLGAISKRAAEDFTSYNPHKFCKAFFSSRCRSDMADNNICEAFNASIINARFKPIVFMLNEIRECAISRLATHKEYLNSPRHWKGNWTSTCMTWFQEQQNMAYELEVNFNGEDGYEVKDRGDTHAVILEQGICTCRFWDLTGIPCRHAIVAINHSNRDPKSFISPWYEKDAYIATYKMPMQCVASNKFYGMSNFEPCEPPPFVRQTGRPRVKRMRSKHEKMKGKTHGNLGKKRVKMTCQICHVVGHNKATCPDKANAAHRSQNEEVMRKQKERER